MVCAAVTADISSAELVEMLCAVLRGERISWGQPDLCKALLQAAQQHGVDALLCHYLQASTAWAELPGPMRDSLRRTAQRHAAAELVRTADLLNLLQQLRKADIPILLCKGAALAYTHYPDPALRPRCDADIFFDYRDIQKIKQLLADLGCCCHGPLYKSHQFTCSRTAARGVQAVYDLHWRLNNTPCFARVFSFEEVRREAVPIPALAGCLTLCPEHALLLACLHQSGCADRLIWLYDIHLLLAGMSEEAVVQFANTAVAKNLQQICLTAIRKARYFFAAKLPEQAIRILETPAAASPMQRKIAASYLGLILDDLSCLPDAAGRFALLRELLLPPADEVLQKYDRNQRGKAFWLPLLYGRYLAAGLLRRIFLLR